MSELTVIAIIVSAMLVFLLAYFLYIASIVCDKHTDVSGDKSKHRIHALKYEDMCF